MRSPKTTLPKRFRLEFTRRHVVFAMLFSTLVVAAVCATYVRTLRHVEAKVGQLRSVTAEQRARLRQIDAQTTQLDSELRGLAHQNEQIRKLIGDPSRPQPSVAPRLRSVPPIHEESLRTRDAFAIVAARIARLRAASSAVRDDGNHLRGLALRILNMKRLEELARAQVLAAIPSVNPGGVGIGIRSAYGWRVDPWPEFHAGVDLDLDYGDPVRAAAAGTVVAAADDGGYGLKIDVDHGNGYHTWYCHLSRVDVRPGEYVTKSQHIALVGSTGASTGPHLHYQVMLDGHAVDPTPYLHGVPARVLASLK
ncbi:MAG: M23 family metallopeptidase [Candidatus Eremiobacteraeota bacterium]|nr:M23 family metallopeptidase [Candidatus Eremiobacteraeota bacterium]